MAKSLWKAFLRGASESFAFRSANESLHFSKLTASPWLAMSRQRGLQGDWYQVGGDISRAIDHFQAALADQQKATSARG